MIEVTGVLQYVGLQLSEVSTNWLTSSFLFKMEEHCCDSLTVAVNN